MKKIFRVSLQTQFEPAFDHNFDGKGEVKTHEADLNMNKNNEFWMLLKFQLDIFVEKINDGQN